MRNLSIPFTKDNKILDLLTLDELQYVKEIFMPLPNDIIASGRAYSASEALIYKGIFDDQIKKAKEMDLQVNILATKPTLDLDEGMTTMLKTVRELERIKPLGADKVTITNLTFLKLNGEYIKSLGYLLELSVLTNIDSFEKVEQILTVHPYIDSMCLNSCFISQKDEMVYLKGKYPNIQFKILVNNLCLFKCAALVEHHNLACNTMIENIDMSDLVSWKLYSNARQVMPNCKLCTFVIQNTNMFNIVKDSTFIRPEDLVHYDDVIDLYKLSGREHPSAELLVNIKAYGERQYNGDFLTIIDIPYPMTYGIDNTKFPEDYVSNKLNCNHKCYNCNYCDSVLDLVRVIPPTDQSTTQV